MRSINPYIVGNPVKDQASFYGRQDIFREVMQVLHQRDSHAVVLYGQRRIGKTSMLLQLEKRLSAEGEFTPIYFDLQDKASKSLMELLYELAQHISRVTGHTIQQAGDFNRTGDYFRDTFLPGIAEKVATGGIVLLFDEFDVLDSPARTQASQAFFPYLRSWMENVQNVKFIFVIGRRPEELSVRSMSAFKGIQSTRVSFMNQSDTEAVVRQSEQVGSLTWETDAIIRIHNLTHGHPYFTQLLCSVVWENNHEEDEENPTATADEVDKAVNQALKMGANAFNWLWDGLPPAERVIMSAMAEVNDAIIKQEQLIETLNQSGVRLIARELELAPETLMDWELLYRVDNGFRFSVPLLRQWVLANRPLRRVKDELDRLDPLADALFQAGQGFYNGSRLTDAEQQLRQALNINPNHLKARLLLGRIYLDQNKLIESVEILEAAYQYDERSARADLLKSLLALAELQSQDEAKQLETYERILLIQPDQPVARDKRHATWVQRGDAAYEKGDFDLAAKAYETVKYQAGIDKVIAALREQNWRDNTRIAYTLVAAQQYKEALDLYDKLISDYPEKQDSVKVDRERVRAMWRDSLIGNIPVYVEDEKWDKVIETCEPLLNQFPEDAVVKGYLENARLQLGVTQKYHEGVGALESGLQDQARKIFAGIISDSPAFGRASLKLVEAMYGKVKISFPVPLAVNLLTFITSSLWTIIPVLVLGNWLNNVLLEALSVEWTEYQYIYIEDFFVFGLVIIPLAGALINSYANSVVDAAYQVERGRYSIRKALWTHTIFGMGLFYVARETRRKWVYALVAVLIPVAVLAQMLYGYANRHGGVGFYRLPNDLEMRESWIFVVIVLLFVHAISFIDVFVTYRQKQVKAVKTTVPVREEKVLPTLSETSQPIGWRNALLLLWPLILTALSWIIVSINELINVTDLVGPFAFLIILSLLIGFMPTLLLAKGDPQRFNWWKMIFIVPLVNALLLWVCYGSIVIWQDGNADSILLGTLVVTVTGIILPLGNLISLVISNLKHGSQTFQTWLLFNIAMSSVVGIVAALTINDTSHLNIFGMIIPLIVAPLYFSITEFKPFSIWQKIGLNVSGVIYFVVTSFSILGEWYNLEEILKFPYIALPSLAGIVVALLYRFKYEQIIALFRRKS